MIFRPALLAIALLSLAGCAREGVHTYAGTPGSTYDQASNPAKANGAVTYDAASPLIPHDYGNGGDSAAPKVR